MNENYIKMISNDLKTGFYPECIITDDMKQYFLEEQKRIQAHLEGTTPTYIDDAYKGETKEQKEYRNSVYRSETKALLLAAIENINKVLESDDFAIHKNQTVDKVLDNTILFNTKIGKGIVKAIFSTIYPRRVKDPNGLVSIKPITKGDEKVKELECLKIEVHSSQNIIYQAHDLIIIKDENIENMFRVYTLNGYYVYELQSDKVEQRFDFIHNRNDIGCYSLGGIYEIKDFKSDNNSIISNNITLKAILTSDFSYAIDGLDKLAQLDSQSSIIELLHMYPKLITYALSCTSCNSKGTIKDGKTTTSCKTCSGTGYIRLGAQNSIEIPHKIDEELKPINPKDVMAYATPELGSANFIEEKKKLKKEDVKKELMIIDTADESQSGTAKMIDLKGQHTKIKIIADSLQILFDNILRALVNFYFPTVRVTSYKEYQEAINSISISMPTSIDLSSLQDKIDAYYANIDKKSTFQRFTELLGILQKKQVPKDEVLIERIAYLYTNGYNLYTVTELNALLLNQEDMYKATTIYGVLANLIETLNKENKSAEMYEYTIDKWKELIDKEYQPLIKKIADLPKTTEEVLYGEQAEDTASS